jgi:BirA family biotin operon repressor/biotin-[acetyl-CoA-carboxylase] ligase
VICGVEFDKEQLLYSIIDQMKQNIDLVQTIILRFLYRETFQNRDSNAFKDNLIKISWDYSRCFSMESLVLLEDDSISEYNLKEIQMLY